MYSFRNDYSEGACSQIMEKISRTNMEQSVGYGEDDYCLSAKEIIKAKLQNEECDIHFLVGGTQANLTVIASMLRPYEAVIAVDSGHINVHETGAIEATGHKVIVVEGKDGKVSADAVRKVVQLHTDEHMVKPSMLYISNATEIGTIYFKEELKELYEVCQELGLYLFMDGARLGAALAAVDNDLAFCDLCKYCDVFYIGGTKNGAMFGEAVVIVNDRLKQDFRYMIKQRGGMLAKGRLLGIQFETLFEAELYLQLASHANDMAQQMQSIIAQHGYAFFCITTTNQIFPILPKKLLQKLALTCQFQVWENIDEEYTAVRFVTSWATPQCAVDQFKVAFEAICMELSSCETL